MANIRTTSANPGWQASSISRIIRVSLMWGKDTWPALPQKNARLLGRVDALQDPYPHPRSVSSRACGRSPGFRITGHPPPSRPYRRGVGNGDSLIQLQWRDRAGLPPASLLSPGNGATCRLLSVVKGATASEYGKVSYSQTGIRVSKPRLTYMDTRLFYDGRQPASNRLLTTRSARAYVMSAPDPGYRVSTQS